MQGGFVDIGNELDDVAVEVEMLQGAIAIFDREAGDATAAWRWLAVQGLAAGVEKIYSGCERIMAMIATTVDGERIGRQDGWHVSLLKRMAHAYPGIRGPVISLDCYRDLDLLRSFRHRQRNTYGLLLDADVVRTRAVQTSAAFHRFRAEINLFITQRAKA
jgi:hypothetical protein